jgi:hypothetical protein
MDAAFAACAGDGGDRFTDQEPEIAGALARLDDGKDLFMGTSVSTAG